MIATAKSTGCFEAPLELEIAIEIVTSTDCWERMFATSKCVRMDCSIDRTGRLWVDFGTTGVANRTNLLRIIVEPSAAVAATDLGQPAAAVGMDCFGTAVASAASCQAAETAAEALVLSEKLVGSGTGFLKSAVEVEPVDLVSRTDSTNSRSGLHSAP